VGWNWRIPAIQTSKRAIRHVTYDTNFWKSFVQTCLAVPLGDPGCLSIFGRNPEQHRMLSEHLTAEYRVRTPGLRGPSAPLSIRTRFGWHVQCL
jgi:hypothetical protein